MKKHGFIGRGSMNRWWLQLIALLVLLLGAFPASAQTIQIPKPNESTLQTVRARGFLICGATNPLPGFAQQDADGKWSGFDVDLCRGIAAAVFGDADKIEFRSLRGEARFAWLQTGVVDVLTRNGAWSQQRDTLYGANFVAPTFFDGQAFMVPQSLGIVSAYELDNVTVCVIDSGDELARMEEFFFANQATYSEVVYEDAADLAIAYRAGLCQAVSATGRQLQAIRRDLPEPASHRILPERISKELLGPVVRTGDDQWFDIVRWTIYTLINAEELGVTSLNIDSLAATRTSGVRRLLGLNEDFGTPLGLSPKFMSNIIRSVGNYAELYDRHFGPQTGAALLRGQNSLWSNGGLLYAPPIR